MTQKEIIVEQLKTHKRVSRNWCLSQHISRLSAIIQELEADGFIFNAHWEGSDYVYDIASTPKKIIRKPIIDRETRTFKGYEEVVVEQEI